MTSAQHPPSDVRKEEGVVGHPFFDAKGHQERVGSTKALRILCAFHDSHPLFRERYPPLVDAFELLEHRRLASLAGAQQKDLVGSQWRGGGGGDAMFSRRTCDCSRPRRHGRYIDVAAVHCPVSALSNIVEK